MLKIAYFSEVHQLFQQNGMGPCLAASQRGTEPSLVAESASAAVLQQLINQCIIYPGRLLMNIRFLASKVLCARNFCCCVCFSRKPFNRPGNSWECSRRMWQKCGSCLVSAGRLLMHQVAAIHFAKTLKSPCNIAHVWTQEANIKVCQAKMIQMWVS